MDLEKMTPRQLDVLATRILMQDRRDRKERGELQRQETDGILGPLTLKAKRRKEVLNEHGVPDVYNGLEDDGVHKRVNPGQVPSFFRSHPHGRKINVDRLTPENKHKRSSYYSG